MGDDARSFEAFFADEWISTGLGSPLQIVCDCDQTHPRLVDVARLLDLVPHDDDAPARSVRLDAVVVGAVG